jgi:hypothetical protein
MDEKLEKQIEQLVADIDKRISEIDSLATAVLKSHFLLEEQIDAVLEAVAKSPQYLDLRRNPTFAQR